MYSMLILDTAATSASQADEDRVWATHTSELAEELGEDVASLVTTSLMQRENSTTHPKCTVGEFPWQQVPDSKQIHVEKEGADHAELYSIRIRWFGLLIRILLVFGAVVVCFSLTLTARQ